MRINQMKTKTVKRPPISVQANIINPVSLAMSPEEIQQQLRLAEWRRKCRKLAIILWICTGIMWYIGYCLRRGGRVINTKHYRF